MEFDQVVLEDEEGDYQGTSYLLVRKGGQWGLLIYGWGSCSGCDALADCNDFRGDVVELRDQLYNSITWGTAAEMREHIATRDWSLDWVGHEETFLKFRTDALTELEAHTPGAR
jgi:hypothetical protein